MNNTHKTVTRNTLYMMLSNILSTVLSAARIFLVAGFLSPADYGKYNLINLILSYVNYADLGTNTGMLYQSAIRAAEGRMTEANNIRKQTWLFTILLSGILSATCLFLSMLPLDIIDIQRNNFFLFGAAVPIILCLNYFHVEARLQDDFRLLSFVTILGGCGTLVFTIMLIAVKVQVLKIEAMIAAGLAGNLLSVIAIARYLYEPLAQKMDWPVIGQVMRHGIPLTLMTMGYALFQSVDRWVILGLVSATEFGYYAFGTTLGIMLAMLPNTLGVVLSTRMIKAFGKSASLNDNSVMVVVSFWVSSYVMAFISGIAIIVMPFFLNYFFYQYLPGLQIITILVVANCLLFSLPVGSNFLLASGKLRTLFAIIFAATIFEGILIYVAVSLGGIEKASYALLICDILLSVCMVSVSTYLLLGKPNWNIKRISGLFIPFLICPTLAIVFNDGSNTTSDLINELLSLLKSLLLYILTAIPLCVIIAYMTGLMKDLPMRWRKPASDL